MVLTSMGVFGFLSKAHLDQAVPSGDIQAQVQIYDDKIKTQRDNIEAARKALRQMDDAVDQTMSRSSTEQGADKAAGLRRSQARERGNLQNDISKAQGEITKLQEARAPISSQARQIEAEVGPIKYIAALIYGDNPDASLLEKAVRWVIILIVIVFDPLALTLLLAATKTFEWERGINILTPSKKEEAQNQEDSTFTTTYNEDEPVFDREEIPLEESIEEPKKKSLWGGFGFPMGSIFSKKEDPVTESVEELVSDDQIDDDHDEIDELEKQARRNWKEAHPGDTIKRHQKLYETGIISELPWNHADYHTVLENDTNQLVPDNVPDGSIGTVRGFGTQFPLDAIKGDMYLRVDRLPSVLYKFNGSVWIEVDKSMSDNYAWDDAYIDHLIAKIGSGEYDPDMLSDAERDRIEAKLKQDNSL
jgi:hypothetical protein